MHVFELLTRAAERHGARPAVSVGTRRFATYGQLLARAKGVGADLGRMGVQRGARVAIVLKNVPEYLECLFGVWAAGAVAVPLNAKLHTREIEYVLGHTQAAAVITHAARELAAFGGARLNVDEPAYAGAVQRAPRPVEAAGGDDTAWLFYTSGTTGRPKGAMLTHQNLLEMVWAYFADIEPIACHDAMIHAAPLSHGSGLYALPHVAAAANNVVPASQGYDVDETLALIEHNSGATLFLAPTMVQRLVRHPGAGERTENLKTIIYGGAPMYVEDVKRALEVLGPKLVQIYGQGEAPMTITSLSRDEHLGPDAALRSVGFARTGVEVMVVDGQDRRCAPGELGEVVCRGAVVMKGYLGDPEASAQALRGGFLHTGDLGRMTPDGLLTLEDRAKDLIISGGSNIYPREVEEVLLTVPGVMEVAVVGRPHDEWGEEVVAFVVCEPGREVAAEELDRACLSSIARFKRPRDYRFVDALPKNNYGKVLRRQLRERVS